MHMCVFVYMCLCVVYACEYVCVHICEYVCVYMCVDVSIYVYECLCGVCVCVVQKTALDVVSHASDLFTLLLGCSLELIKQVRLGGHQFPGMQASCPKPGTTHMSLHLTF